MNTAYCDRCGELLDIDSCCNHRDGEYTVFCERCGTEHTITDHDESDGLAD